MSTIGYDVPPMGKGGRPRLHHLTETLCTRTRRFKKVPKKTAEESSDESLGPSHAVSPNPFLPSDDGEPSTEKEMMLTEHQRVAKDVIEKLLGDLEDLQTLGLL